MSRTPYFYLEMKNDEGKWELVAPLVKAQFGKHKGEFVKAELWPYNGSHELFDALQGRSFCNVSGVHVGLPNDATDDVKKDYYDMAESYAKTFGKTIEDSSCYPKASYIYYSDIYIYFLEFPEKNQNLKIDEDEIDEFEYKNPLINFKKRIDSFINIWDDFYEIDEHRNDIRIIFWIT